jgi:hypothetical protein
MEALTMVSAEKICLAAPEDDAQLRDLYSRSALSGALEIVYKREPSFFHALGVMGDESRVMVVRQDDRIIATGTLTFFKAFVQGTPRTIGYLHSLRVDPAYRYNIFLARGFEKVHELAAARGIPFYIATIIEDNNPLVRLIQKPRAFMPPFQDIGRFTTYVIPLFRKKRRTSSRLAVAPAAGSAELEEGIDWIQQRGRTRDLFPVFTREIFQNQWMKDYGLQELLIARRGGSIAGTLAAWDQGRFRQTAVKAYHGKWRLFKSCYNALAPVLGGSRLPQANEEFKYMFAAFPAAAGDDPGILRELMRALCERALSAGYTYVVIGLHESAPLSKALAGFFTIRYTSRVYMIALEGRKQYDVRFPYLELARL